MFGLVEYGVIGIVVLILLCLILLPVILTVLVGIAFANLLGFTGIFWWAFVILFYLIVSAILTSVGL